MATKGAATVGDLYRSGHKAELVNGELVVLAPTGDLPSSAAGAIYASLRDLIFVEAATTFGARSAGAGVSNERPWT